MDKRRSCGLLWWCPRQADEQQAHKERTHASIRAGAHKKRSRRQKQQQLGGTTLLADAAGGRKDGLHKYQGALRNGPQLSLPWSDSRSAVSCVHNTTTGPEGACFTIDTPRAHQQLPPEQEARQVRGATPSYATFDKDYILGRQVILSIEWHLWNGVRYVSVQACGTLKGMV